MVAEGECARGEGALEAVLNRYGVVFATFSRRRDQVFGNPVRRVPPDPRLIEVVERKIFDFRTKWQAEAVNAMRTVLSAITHGAELALKLETFDPDVQYSLNGSGKIVGELLTVREAALPSEPRAIRQDRSTEAPPGSDGGPSGGGSPSNPGSNGRSNGHVTDVVH